MPASSSEARASVPSSGSVSAAGSSPGSALNPASALDSASAPGLALAPAHEEVEARGDFRRVLAFGVHDQLVDLRLGLQPVVQIVTVHIAALRIQVKSRFAYHAMAQVCVEQDLRACVDWRQIVRCRRCGSRSRRPAPRILLDSRCSGALAWCRVHFRSPLLSIGCACQRSFSSCARGIQARDAICARGTCCTNHAAARWATSSNAPGSSNRCVAPGTMLISFRQRSCSYAP